MKLKGFLPYASLGVSLVAASCAASQTDNIITSLRNLGYTEAQINELLSSDSLEVPLYIVESGLKADLYTTLTASEGYRDDLFFRYIPLVVKYTNSTVTIREIVSVTNDLYDKLGYRQDQFVTIKNSKLTFEDVKKLLANQIDPNILTSLFGNKDRNSNYDSRYLETLIKITDGRSSDFLSGATFDIKKIIGGTNVLDAIGFDYSQMSASGLIELFEYVDTIIKRSEELALGSLGHTWESIDKLNPGQKETIYKRIEEFLNRYLQDNQDAISSVAALIRDKTPTIASSLQIGSGYQFENNTLKIEVGSLPAGTTISSIIANNLNIVATYIEGSNTVDISSLLSYEIEAGFNPNEISRYTVRASVTGTATNVDELSSTGKYLSSRSNIFIEIVDVAPTFENIAGDVTSGDSRENFMTINAVLAPQALTTIDAALADIKFNYAGNVYTIHSDEVTIKYYKFDSVLREYVTTSRGDAIGNVHRIKIQVIFTTRSGMEIAFASEINISTTDVLAPIIVLDNYSATMELGDTTQALLARIGNDTITDNTSLLQDLIINRYFEIGGTTYDIHTVDLRTLNINPNSTFKYVVTAEDEEGNIGVSESRITARDSFAPSVTFTGVGSSQSNPARYTGNDIFTNTTGIQNFVNTAGLNFAINDNDAAWVASNPTITIGNQVGTSSYHNINTFEYHITDRGGNRASGFIYIEAVDTQAPTANVLGDIYIGTGARPHLWVSGADLREMLVGYVEDNDWAYVSNGRRPISVNDVVNVQYKRTSSLTWTNGNQIPYRDMNVLNWGDNTRKFTLSEHKENFDVRMTLNAQDNTGNAFTQTYEFKNVEIQHGHSGYGNSFISSRFSSTPDVLFNAVKGPNGEFDWGLVSGGAQVPDSTVYLSHTFPQLAAPINNFPTHISGLNVPFIIVHVYTSKDFEFAASLDRTNPWYTNWKGQHDGFIGAYGTTGINSNWSLDRPLLYENNHYKHWAIPYDNVANLNVPFKSNSHTGTIGPGSSYAGAWEFALWT